MMIPPTPEWKILQLSFGNVVDRLIDWGNLQVTRIRGCVRVSVEEIRRFEEILVETEYYRK